MLELTNKIVRTQPDSFLSFIVTGKRGIGKSVYSLKAVAHAYMQLGYNEEGAWDMALKSVKFSINEVVDYLEYAVIHHRKHMALIWDDVRVHAAGTAYHLNMKLIHELTGLLDTIRTSLNILIMTCPTTQGLLKVLQSYDDYQIIIRYSPRGGLYREATGYIWRTLPSGQRRVRGSFVDNYRCYMPTKYYKKYMVLRERALATAIKRVKEAAQAEK